ncbi:tyrosine recombinase XerC [Clostridium botulinum]|uniref:tyrosine recombinase XerC n=2 Tax=Clostridium botulinum TaxID=1491 RepID=UPI0004DAB9CB|nr:tyrosine recombinase XerC [Clostridium botulinum]KEH99957.1 recombinase XerC [Clostridium botulinum C/D str. BKT75002]KEI05679.1 recombinase XerC [Clostridium botulinum C/D str. BKT2873]
MKFDFNFKDIREKTDTLPQCMTSFFNYSETIKGNSTGTIKGYEVDLTMFFRFLKIYKNLVPNELEFEEIPINDIDYDFLRQLKLTDLYAFMSFTEKYRNNSSNTRARKVSTLKAFFKYLYGKIKVLDYNIADELEKPKIEKRNPIYLTLEESKKLLSVIHGKSEERDYCILNIFLNCGLRISELCSIQISKIKGDTLTVIGKGNKERTVYLNKACMDSIADYLKVRNSFGSKVPLEDRDILFLNKNYSHISKRSVEKMVKKYVEKAGLDTTKYTPHKLRHTAATLMFKYGGVDIRKLQLILGHESISTTEIYTHVDNEGLRAAVKSNPLNNETV